MDAKPRWVLWALLNAKLPLNIVLDKMAMVVLAEVRDMVVVHGVVAVIMSLIVLMRIWP